MRLLSVALILTILSSSCFSRFVKVDDMRNREQYIEQITVYNQHIEQVQATLDIRAYGVLKTVIHEQADVIAQAPHFIYWSLRSFFGPPSMVFAANGEYLTTIDYTNQRNYQKMAINSDSFFELLDFRFYPQSLIDILLAKVPINKLSVLRIALDKVEIDTELLNGWRVRTIFDQEKNSLAETVITNTRLAISYHAKYENYGVIKGISFPQSLVLMAKGKGRFLRLHVEMSNIELNGAKVSPNMFYLDAH